MFEGVDRYAYVDSRIGRLLLAGDGDSLHLLSFQTGSRVHHPRDGWRHDPRAFPEVRRQLSEYFAGKRTTFTLPLVLTGTPFQNAVWTTLQSIPFGATTT